MVEGYKEALRTIKLNIWTKCTQDRVKWKLRRPKLSNREDVAPDK